MSVVTGPTSAQLNDLPDLERDIFEQVASLDDDQVNFEFTRQLTDQFFEQARQTISNMELLVAQKRLSEISKLGHFLKGSAAALGLAKMKTACEAIQHYGANKDPYNSMMPVSDEQALQIVTHLVAVLKDLSAMSKMACDNKIRALQHSI